MFKVVLLLLLAVIFIEFYVLVAVSQMINVLPTLLLAFGSAILGFRILIKQARRYIKSAQQEIAQGQRVDELLSQAILMLFCGIFLIIPGLISDVIGLLLLLPMIRGLLIAVG